MHTLTQQQLEQYQAITRGVGVADWPGQTLLELTGEDRARFLHNLCTNDILRLTPGQGCEALLCTVQGKILAHLLVFCHPASLVLATVPSQAERLLTHLDKYIIREDVQLTDRSTDWSQLVLAGPGAADLLSRGNSPTPDQYLQHRSGTWDSVGIVVRRVAWVGPESYLVQCPTESAPRVQQRFVAWRATVCEPAVMESLRIEHGYPWYGRDITEQNLPQEIGRDELTISFTKGCYLGQETVARIDALGHVNWRLARVRCDSDRVPAAGTPVLAGEEPAGQITSAAWSPRYSGPLALALLRTQYAAPGTELAVDGGAAQVMDPPPGPGASRDV